MAQRVYMVFHDFVSHDMFVPYEAKIGNPKFFGVFSNREEAEKHIRPHMDDYIIEGEIDNVK